MRRVIIESPYSGDVAKHVAYAQRALRHSLLRGEAPIASHLLHTQVLDDGDPTQRLLGMLAGHEWIAQADAVVFYVDHGMSQGMVTALSMAQVLGVKTEVRRLDP